MESSDGKWKLSLTLDLEWWGRAHLLPGAPSFPDGIDRDLGALEEFLELLTTNCIKATFFCVSGDFESDILRKIVAGGNEVASHSITHPHFAAMSRDQWRYETGESKRRLEDATGVAVSGFRTPSWSVPFARAEEFHEVLLEEGYGYDSSFCSLKTPLYGDPAFAREPYVGPAGLVEIPVPIIGFPRAPWVGGAYFRLAPYFVLKQWILGTRPAFLYFHPWEFYENPPVKGDLMTRLALNHGRRNNLAKLSALIGALKKRVNFVTMKEYAEGIRRGAAQAVQN